MSKADAILALGAVVGGGVHGGDRTLTGEEHAVVAYHLVGVVLGEVVHELVGYVAQHDLVAFSSQLGDLRGKHGSADLVDPGDLMAGDEHVPQLGGVVDLLFEGSFEIAGGG